MVDKSRRYALHYIFMQWLEAMEDAGDKYDKRLIERCYFPRGAVKTDYDKITEQFIKIKMKRDRLRNLLIHYDVRHSVEIKYLADALMDKEEESCNILEPEIVVVPWVPMRDNGKLLF